MTDSGYDPLLSMQLVGEIKEVKFEMQCMRREIEGLCKIMQKLSVSNSKPKKTQLKNSEKILKDDRKKSKSKSPKILKTRKAESQAERPEPEFAKPTRSSF